MDFKDYYATLGVAKTATAKDIKQAFRRLARKHHPDVNPGDKSAESKFKELNEAYEVLGDPATRKKYDELGANWRMYEQAGRAGAGADGSPWQGPFGPGAGPGGGGFRTMTEEEMREMFGDADPFSDFFHTFFGGAAGPEERGGRPYGARPRAGRQGRSVEQEIELGLEDAYFGTTRRLAITSGGRARTVDVRIPPGVGEGSRVRIPGEGEQGSGGARSGDLYLRIRLAPHPTIDRKGRDLFTRVSVPLTTAVLGGEAEAPTLGGKTLRLKVPPTTQNGQRLRLKGHGMPSVGKPDEMGDLYVTIEVALPRTLTPEQQALFESLKKLEGGPKNTAASRETAR
jgi:DnaJ-class molecular chaperone